MRTKVLSGLGMLAGTALLAAVAATPAQAQGAPGGSYLQSCNDVRMHDGRVIANCRRADGSWARSAIDAEHCRGGIANMNGNLTCNDGAGVARDEYRDRWSHDDYRDRWARDRDFDRHRDFDGSGSSWDRGVGRPGWDYYGR